MDISVTEFKQRCLEIIREVERTGRAVSILRRGRVVARVAPPPPAKPSDRLKRIEALRRHGGTYLAEPDESVIRDEDFEALR